MCRYMFDRYRTHLACLPCRRVVKAERYWPQQCRSCQAPMLDLGRDFHAPRRRDVTQWRKVTLLVQAGLRFHSCGCSGPGPRPRTLADAKTQLRRRRTHRRSYARSARNPTHGRSA